MSVGLCDGDEDKYFFRHWKSGNQQLTTTAINITIIISTSTTENPSINHHHLIATVFISSFVISNIHREAYSDLDSHFCAAVVSSSRM